MKVLAALKAGTEDVSVSGFPVEREISLTRIILYEDLFFTYISPAESYL